MSLPLPHFVLLLGLPARSYLCRHYYVLVASVVSSRLPSAAFTLTFDLCLAGVCSTVSRSGVLRTQKLRPPSVENPELTNALL